MHKENILLIASILMCITLLLGVPATWKVDALGPLAVIMLICTFLVRQEHRARAAASSAAAEPLTVPHATPSAPYADAYPSPLDVHTTPAPKPRRRKVAVTETV